MIVWVWSGLGSVPLGRGGGVNFLFSFLKGLEGLCEGVWSNGPTQGERGRGGVSFYAPSSLVFARGGRWDSNLF